MKLRLIPIVIVLFALLVCAIPHSTHAGVSYLVAPLVIDLKAQARDIMTREVVITNTGTQPITVYPTVNNISLDAGGTIQEFHSPVESDRTQSLTSWIEFRRSGIDIPVGKTGTLTVTFRINPDPVPGVYHALLGFGSGRNQDEAIKQVQSGDAPGIVITVTIADDKVEFLKLSRFIVSRFVTSANNEAAVYTFRNPGDEVLTPTGEIIFYDSTGEEVGTVKVNEEGAAIAPGEEKIFRAAVPTDGLFGKYKAFLDVEYGNRERASVQDTSFFYVFPLKIMLMMLGVIMLVVLFVALYVHKKYIDESTMDDSDPIPLRIKDTTSDPKHHDIDLTRV